MGEIYGRLRVSSPKSSLPELKHLLLTDVETRRQIASLDSMEMTNLKPGDGFYLIFGSQISRMAQGLGKENPN